MACSLCPATEVATRLQRAQPSAAEPKPPGAAPAPLKVKIKFGGKLVGKKGQSSEPGRPQDSSSTRPILTSLVMVQILQPLLPHPHAPARRRHSRP